jgi:hypothetical protein
MSSCKKLDIREKCTIRSKFIIMFNLKYFFDEKVKFDLLTPNRQEAIALRRKQA